MKKPNGKSPCEKDMQFQVGIQPEFSEVETRTLLIDGEERNREFVDRLLKEPKMVTAAVLKCVLPYLFPNNIQPEGVSEKKHVLFKSIKEDSCEWDSEYCEGETKEEWEDWVRKRQLRASSMNAEVSILMVWGKITIQDPLAAIVPTKTFLIQTAAGSSLAMLGIWNKGEKIERTRLFWFEQSEFSRNGILNPLFIKPNESVESVDVSTVEGLFVDSENKIIRPFSIPGSWGKVGTVQPLCKLENGDALYIVEARGNSDAQFRIDGVCDIRGNAFVIGIKPNGDWTTANSKPSDLRVEFIGKKGSERSA